MEGVDATFLPFYFNAWSNDFADDPIIALLANMAVEFERYGLLRESKASEIVAAIVDAGLTFAGVPVKASSIVDSLTGKSVVDAYVDRAKTRSRIDQLCNDVLSKKADKIIVVIDELDRCRPDFAVHLLEQTKSLFASSNVIFVFATDSSQLAKAVGGVYGSGFDTTHFLERFFDERVTMTPVDSYAFTHDGRPLPSGFRFDNLVSEVYSSRVFTIRDSFRIKEKLDAARLHCAGSQYDDLPHLVAQQTVLPLLILSNMMIWSCLGGLPPVPIQMQCLNTGNNIPPSSKISVVLSSTLVVMETNVARLKIARNTCMTCAW